MVLFEVMIALALAILCAVPLLVKPISIYRSELRLLEAGEGERLADLAFAEVKEQLLQRQIPWEKLPSYQNTSPTFHLSPVMLEIPNRGSKKIERSFTFYCKGEKEGKNKEICRILYVMISFDPKLSMRRKANYAYRIVVEREAEKESL